MVPTVLIVVSIWKRHRKIISPAFNQRVLDGFVEVFGSQSTIMVEELDKLVGKGEFDVFHVVSKTTLNIICGKD
jgi:cytochrome P450